MNALQQYLARVDDLSLRERGIIMSGILIILFLGWYSWLMEPRLKEQASLQEQLDSKRNQLQTLNTQLEELSRHQNNSPDKSERRLLEDLREEITLGQEALMQATVDLITPQQIPDILQQVLNRSDGLSLIRLQGLGAVPLLGNEDADAPPSQAPSASDKTGNLSAAYQHGMQIEFRGGFLETLAYINALEDMERGFFWESIDYRVTEYPLAVTTLTLYTISLDSHWISI